MVCEKPTEGELLPGQLITVWGNPTESESLYWDVDPWYSHHHARQGSGQPGAMYVYAPAVTEGETQYGLVLVGDPGYFTKVIML